MFSVQQKRQIADAIQQILRQTGHPELPSGEIKFHLHVDGAEPWSWADIRDNGSVGSPAINPWKEAQAQFCATTAAAPAVVAVAVSERLPEPGVKVLAYYLNELSNGRTVCAIWVPAKTRSDSYGDDDFTEYDEKTDTFYWPEGWYEAIENWDDLGYVKVDEGEVIYWQPLPQWPWAYAIAAELRGGADG